MALGAALLAAPASATALLQSEVGADDAFLGACAAGPGSSGLADEIICINLWQDEHDFVESDALKMEDLTGLFMQVDTNNNLLDGIQGETWAAELAKQGGWYSMKTGSITCDVSVVTGCESGEDKYFLIFENLDELMYAVLNLTDMSSTYGFHLDNIGKISHITIVPLPAAALLFGSALLGGGLMRRRKMIKKYGLPV